MPERIIIANAGGFWGDDPTAARRQLEGGPIDYLVTDYLAEVTMALLQKQRRRRPEEGFATDFITQLEEVLPLCVERGVRIIANAGGLNPMGCKAAVERLAKELGLEDRVRVAAVLGDDIAGRLDELQAAGEILDHMDDGRPLAELQSEILSANVYLGAAPVVRALEMGANIVVTGRVTDTAVTLAPMMYEFGWAADDWDRLAAGIIAGHIIECSTQCAGGNFTDWEQVTDFLDVGFPLVEAYPDGSFVVTKHPGTGGLVNVHTVSEQLLYEMGTPRYIAPDCVARFDSITLTEDGPNRVRVTGARGEPAPEKLKVAISYAAGHRSFGRLMVSGPKSVAKATRVAEIIWAAAGGRELYDETLTQFLGWDSTHPPLSDYDPSEVLVQVAARDADRAKINQRFCTSIVPRVLGSVPGITFLADQGRPRPSDVIGYWPALISREHVPMHVAVGEDQAAVPQPAAQPMVAAGDGYVAPTPDAPAEALNGPLERVPLEQICLGRSGDKGDTSNIGLIARSPALYWWMLENITPAFVKERFGDWCNGAIERHEVPNLLACNFLLHESLGGGGMLTLRVDMHGKSYAQYLLAAEVEVPRSLLDDLASVSA